MRLSFDTLAEYPTAFHALVGKPPSVLRKEAHAVGRTLDANVSAQRNRPGRRRAPGAGRPFVLSGHDLVLCVHLAVRFGSFEGVAILMGVSTTTVARAVSRVMPELRRGGNPPVSLPSDVRRSLLVAALDLLPEEYEQLCRLLPGQEQQVIVNGVVRDAITGRSLQMCPSQLALLTRYAWPA